MNLWTGGIWPARPDWGRSGWASQRGGAPNRGGGPIGGGAGQAEGPWTVGRLAPSLVKLPVELPVELSVKGTICILAF